MLRFAAGFGNQRDDVRQGLARFRDKVRAVEFLFRIPADLAGEEHHTALGGDAVGKAFRLFPVLRVKERMSFGHFVGVSLSSVVPAKAGTHNPCATAVIPWLWIPAF